MRIVQDIPETDTTQCSTCKEYCTAEDIVVSDSPHRPGAFCEDCLSWWLDTAYGIAGGTVLAAQVVHQKRPLSSLLEALGEPPRHCPGLTRVMPELPEVVVTYDDAGEAAAEFIEECRQQWDTLDINEAHWNAVRAHECNPTESTRQFRDFIQKFTWR